MKIVLQDINDNFPSFDKPSYTVTISEATEMNRSVITVKVTFQCIEHTILLHLFSNTHKRTVILNYLFVQTTVPESLSMVNKTCLISAKFLPITTAIEQVLKRERNA